MSAKFYHRKSVLADTFTKIGFFLVKKLKKFADRGLPPPRLRTCTQLIGVFFLLTPY